MNEVNALNTTLPACKETAGEGTLKKLHVVTCISNPVRWASRPNLYKEFADRMANEPLVELWTVEVATGDRNFEVTDPNNSHHLQLRTSFELWHKENMQNLMLQRIPNDGCPVAFIDTDVDFMRPDWVKETLHQLQHFSVVQMFSQTLDLDSDSQMVGSSKRKGMMYEYVEHGGGIYPTYHNGYTKRGTHCGYAWAWRRDALNTVGGLIDFSIVGSGDWQMACGLLGDITKSVNDKCSDGYMSQLKAWGERAKKLRKNVGYVSGLLVHYWHGPKSSRGYNWRSAILTDVKFDPLKDIHRDWQGLWQLTDGLDERSVQLRDGIRKYFRSRNEDLKSENTI